MWSGLARGLRGPLGKRRKPRAPAGGRQMRPAQRNRAWSTERQPAHAFWSANLTTRRLLGPTWRPLKALMAVAACTKQGVRVAQPGGPARLRAQQQAQQPAWHSMQASPPAAAAAAAVGEHLLAGGVGEESTALGAPLGAQDGQLQNVTHGAEQGPQVLLNGLQGAQSRQGRERWEG
jgi:hypothetical protein